LQGEGLIPETLDQHLIDLQGGMSREDAFRQIHVPQTRAALDAAVLRLKFEELFFIQLQLLKQKLLMQQSLRGQVFSNVGDHFNSFYSDHLPFELTEAQKRVVKEIRKDMVTGHQMNRLVQGDVGSGKTLVALLSMLIALDNGFQSAFMAPTEILAQQHYTTLVKFLEGLPITIRLLTGSVKTAERRSILMALKAGEIHIIVGTHALLEDRVVFDKLGLVVIDEQHGCSLHHDGSVLEPIRRRGHVLARGIDKLGLARVNAGRHGPRAQALAVVPGGLRGLEFNHGGTRASQLLQSVAREVLPEELQCVTGRDGVEILQGGLGIVGESVDHLPQLHDGQPGVGEVLFGRRRDAGSWLRRGRRGRVRGRRRGARHNQQWQRQRDRTPSQGVRVQQHRLLLHLPEVRKRAVGGHPG